MSKDVMACGVQQRECDSDDWIARSREPAHLFRRQLLHVASQCLDEQRLSHLGEQNRSSGTY
jgi:hypothetical protein